MLACHILLGHITKEQKTKQTTTKTRNKKKKAQIPNGLILMTWGIVLAAFQQVEIKLVLALRGFSKTKTSSSLT